MRKRGAALGWHFYLLAGGVAPRFFALCLFHALPFSHPAFLCLRLSAFLPLPSRSHSNPRSLTHSQGLSRNPNRPIFFGITRLHPPKNRK